ncbi:MAG: alpha/beta hydrolase fold domain-containing protein [Pirellula sp.]
MVPLLSQSACGEDPVEKVTYSVRAKYDVPYTEARLPLQLADLYAPVIPKGSPSTKFPGVIMIHGGAWIAGDKLNDAGHARRLAARGYVVMTINYRLAPKDKYPAQVDDCRQALKWFHEHADEWNVDVERLGVYGYSAGGHLALMLATCPSDGAPRLGACVAGGAPCDFSLLPEDSSILAPFLGGTRQQLPDVYREASPIEHVTPDDPPIFVFHGEDDQLVPIEYAERLKQRIEAAQVTLQYLTIPKKSHIMAFVDRSALDAAIDFFDVHLREPKSPDPAGAPKPNAPAANVPAATAPSTERP